MEIIDRNTLNASIELAKLVENSIKIDSHFEHTYLSESKRIAHIEMLINSIDYRIFFDSSTLDKEGDIQSIFYSESNILIFLKSELKVRIFVYNSWKETKIKIRQLNKLFDYPANHIIGDANQKTAKMIAQFKKAHFLHQQNKKVFNESGAKGRFSSNLNHRTNTIRIDLINFFTLHWAEELTRKGLISISNLNKKLRVKDEASFIYWLTAEEEII